MYVMLIYFLKKIVVPQMPLKITPAVIELNLSSDSETTCGLFCIMPGTETDEKHIVLDFKELSPL